jgi:hypothetical protein
MYIGRIKHSIYSMFTINVYTFVISDKLQSGGNIMHICKLLIVDCDYCTISSEGNPQTFY